MLLLNFIVWDFYTFFWSKVTENSIRSRLVDFLIHDFKLFMEIMRRNGQCIFNTVSSKWFTSSRLFWVGNDMDLTIDMMAEKCVRRSSIFICHGAQLDYLGDRGNRFTFAEVFQWDSLSSPSPFTSVNFCTKRDFFIKLISCFWIFEGLKSLCSPCPASSLTILWMWLPSVSLSA